MPRIFLPWVILSIIMLHKQISTLKFQRGSNQVYHMSLGSYLKPPKQLALQQKCWEKNTLAVNFESYEVKMLIASDMDATPVAGGLSRYAIQ